MKNRLMLVILLGMFLFSFASVNAFDSHKQNTNYDLTISHNTATSCQATWIKFPNGTQNILNSDMTKDGTTFYSTISSGNFSNLGTTCFGLSCTDGSTNEVGSKCIDVTTNGNAPADGITIVVYTIIFILIFGFGVIYFLKSLTHVLDLNMDLIDTAIMMVTYLGMWMFYYFSSEYLGNAFINNILEIIIDIGWITHIFFPLIGFALSFIMTNLKFKKKLE